MYFSLRFATCDRMIGYHEEINTSGADRSNYRSDRIPESPPILQGAYL